jgi:26S proteasome regulatory subunit N5
LKCWKNYRTATIEHNIKVFATYYERAYLSHMSEFLDINVDETEKHLCNLIVNKSIKAKIDRLTGIVSFKHTHFTVQRADKPTTCQQDHNLKSWLHQISTLMDVIDSTTHLINKEMKL